MIVVASGEECYIGQQMKRKTMKHHDDMVSDTQYVADRYGLLTARTPSFKHGEEKLFAFTGITPPRHLCKAPYSGPLMERCSKLSISPYRRRHHPYLKSDRNVFASPVTSRRLYLKYKVKSARRLLFPPLAMAAAPNGNEKFLERVHNTRSKNNSGDQTPCIQRRCSHPRGRSWVECSRCRGWWHCLCAGMPLQKAKKEDFDYVCCDCSQ